MTDVSYNCDCDGATGRTLADLRTDLMGRLGFAAQTSSPPPGMVTLLNSFLIEAQKILYRRFSVLHTSRYFSWPIVAGTRYYDLAANSDTCTAKLDPGKIEWVGWSEDGMNWRSLIAGIPPSLYNSTGPDLVPTGYPRRYEVRECIEIWPAPDVSDLYTLRIRGHFGLQLFAADTDKATIDDEPLFLLALANAKAHYGQPDANNYIAQMEAMLSNLVAESHNTRRYIPGGRPELIYVEPRPTVPW